ncbi:response regulator [Anaerolineales bacterium HSG25]|nr:response regulator [Anaerolineales bacterium HSG25]
MYEGTILLVDDEQEITEEFSRSLRRAGYTIEVAHSGEEGWQKCQETRFDMVITDWRMGRMSGLQLAQKINETYPATRVIIITAFNRKFEKELDSAFYLADYLKKPVDIDNLLNKVKGAMAHKERLPLPDENTCFLEGLTDVTIFHAAIKLFAPTLSRTLQLRSEHGAGYNWVKDKVIAWVSDRRQAKVAGIFDSDLDALDAKKELDEFIHNKPKARTFSLKKYTPSHLHGIFQKGIKIPISLEEIYSPSILQHAETQGWLGQRVDVTDFNKVPVDISFTQHCQDKGLTSEELLYVLHSVKDGDKKRKLVRYIMGLSHDELKDALAGFQPVIRALEEYFQ